MANKNLYVGNLPFSTTNADLEQLFSQYGAVAKAKVIMDRETGRSRGFGFVEMSDGAEAAVAAPPHWQEAVFTVLKKGGVKQIAYVPDAGHSFMTRTEGLMGRIVPHAPIHAEYHEPSAEDAFRRITAFFEQHLSGSAEQEH